MSRNNHPLSLAIGGAALLLAAIAAGPVQAGVGPTDFDAAVPCQAFNRSEPGVWTATAPATLDFGSFAMHIAPGQSFPPGSTTNGVEIPSVLDRHCGNQR